MIVTRIPVLAIWIALGAYFGTGVTVSLSAPAIQGTASVIDGDTIDIRGERIRLDAIDAPDPEAGFVAPVAAPPRTGDAGDRTPPDDERPDNPSP